jgi:hypothetical protein
MAKQDEGRTMNEGQYQNMMADRMSKMVNDRQVASYTPLPSMSRGAGVQGLSPSSVCRMCNNTILGDHPEKGAWELKWSVHWLCAEATYNMLDRKTGILSERRQ